MPWLHPSDESYSEVELKEESIWIIHWQGGRLSSGFQVWMGRTDNHQEAKMNCKWSNSDGRMGDCGTLYHEWYWSDEGISHTIT